MMIIIIIIIIVEFSILSDMQMRFGPRGVNVTRLGNGRRRPRRPQAAT